MRSTSSNLSTIERIGSLHWERLNNTPPQAPKRSAPANLRKVRGTVTKGQYSERPGLLGTFVADPRPVDSVSYFPANAKEGKEPGTVFVSVTRSHWVNWRGYVSAAQFEALRQHIGADKVRPAFGGTFGGEIPAPVR